MSDIEDDRSSISELRQLSASSSADAKSYVLEDVPVLLEIARTGLAWVEAEDAMERAGSGTPRALAAMHATRAFDTHRAALSRVRP